MARRGTGGGPGTPAVTALTRAGVSFRLRAFRADPGSSDATSSYGRQAATALGVAPERVFKTLVTLVDGAATVAVVPVSASLDLKALAGALGGKRAELADPAVAERLTGYVVGGISPFGQRRALPTVVDVSALGHAAVLVSGGRRGLDLELSPADLIEQTGALSAPIAR